MAKKKEDPGLFGGGGWLGLGIGRSDPNAPAAAPPPKVKSAPLPKQVHRSDIDPNNPWVKSARGQEEAAVKATGGKFKRSEESGVNPNLPWVKSQRERDARVPGSSEPATSEPSGPRKPKTTKKAAVITSTPSATAGHAKTVSPNTGVQSWHVGGNVPNKRLIDPGTQSAATSRQIKPRAQAHAGLKAQGAKHSTKGLHWFRKGD